MTSLPDSIRDAGITIVFDVDGTVRFDGRTIAPDVVRQLRRCRQRRPIAFASARPLRDLLPVLPDDLHDCLLIGGNGAFVRGPGIDHTVTFPESVRAALDDWLDREQLSYLVDGAWNYAFEGDTARKIFRQVDPGGLARRVSRGDLDVYTKAVVFTMDAAHLRLARELGVTVHAHDDEQHLDLSPRGVDKASALLRAGVHPDGYIAFGNDANDVAMLAGARFAVCVGDHPAAGAVATSRVAPDDVARMLTQLADEVAR